MAMDKGAADCYVYARISGILARSFVGKRASELFTVHSLQDLWTLVFKSEVPAIPEALLARELESNAQRRFVSEYKKLVATYEKPAPVLLALLHFYDYDNIKEIGAALCFNEKEMPAIADTRPFNIVNYDKWPDIKAMTANTPLSWYDTVPTIQEQQEDDYRLDCQFVEELFRSANQINTAGEKAILSLFEEKFQIENVLWSLRLRLFYDMDSEEIKKHLVYDKTGKLDLVSMAIKTLDWDTDSWEQWKDWTYAGLLNPGEEGGLWSIDPRWISNAYKREYVQKAYRMFHKYPFTVCPVVCFYIIKQHELNNIRTACECLRLHSPVEEALTVAGVSEVYNG
ncbi:MAG: V-type ATPase subunit [Treponema sp.]|nr:V-type ATPase subunit [Treponema sp.]